MLGIKEEFEIVFSKTHFDTALINNLHKFQIAFINKNNEHMEFFGGKLMGVHVVKFIPKDVTNLFEILGIQSKELEEAIKRIPTIDKSRFVTSDPFNLACIYVAHMFLSNTKLDEKNRQRGAFLIMLILNYRFMTGIMNRFFQYPIDKEMAQALYANLSYKFLIKRLRNWEEVLEYRALSIVGPNELHHKTLLNFNDDNEVLKVIADSQGRIKDMMKNIYREFIKTYQNGERIYLNNDTATNDEGVEVLRDRTAGLGTYQRYIMDVLTDSNSFIRNELVNVLVDLMDQVNPSQLVKTLQWMSDQILTDNGPDIEGFVMGNLVFSFDYVTSNQSILHHTKDLGLFLSTLRGAYMSSRSKDDILLTLRERGEWIVGNALNTTNKTTLAMMRTAIMLYVNLRAYTKAHYTNG